MNGTSGFKEIRSSPSPSPSSRFLHFCVVTLLAFAGLWMTACVHVDVNISSPNYDQDPEASVRRSKDRASYLDMR